MVTLSSLPTAPDFEASLLKERITRAEKTAKEPNAASIQIGLELSAREASTRPEIRSASLIPRITFHPFTIASNNPDEMVSYGSDIMVETLPVYVRIDYLRGDRAHE
ncbi:MAG: hypothetical protein SWK76_03560 [Actinomycetota bacterium]|nr:hypothetical protein [Actinomycetota bacterium]